MKIEIDLGDIIGKGGVLQEEVREDIVKQASQMIYDSANDKLQETIKDVVVKSVSDKMKSYVLTLMDEQFDETDSWNSKKKTWTVRERIKEEIKNQCVVANRDNYNKNAFTEIVWDTIKDEVKEANKQIMKQTNEYFYQQILDNAKAKLAERLGFIIPEQ